ncbi:MAG: DUF3667 domain-containing protein [Acidobacteria bacterium]|nr:DUF3667 domain-containing protein [Acidobacteriota bacterium]
MGACLNCNQPLTGKYCANCGQSGNVGRLTTPQLLSDAFAHWFNFDSQVFRTVKQLTLNPGGTSLSYITGQRVSYVPPFRYFLVNLALLILLQRSIGLGVESISQEWTDSLGHQAIQTEMVRFLSSYQNLLIAAALPFFAACVWIFFRRSGHTYAEVMACVLYVMGHLFLLNMVLVLIFRTHISGYVAARSALQAIFYVWAFRKFFQQSMFATVIKSILALAAYFASITLIAVVVVVAIIL